jgi:Ca-activated chloride channel family protein
MADSSMLAGPAAKRDARIYLEGFDGHGGTNVHDALAEALRCAPRAGSLPIVLFLTDGLPTVGTTSEVAIRDMVQERNHYEKRLFTFGVGHDVNVPLLDRLASTTRATSTYVLPGEDVEVKAAQVFERLRGPVLAGLELQVVDENGLPTTQLVRDVLPAPLPDGYEGDRLVLLGRYTGAGPLRFRLRGEHRGEARTFALDFGRPQGDTRNTFVPRLWASRRIADLVDLIREATAHVAGHPADTGAVDPMNDPHLRELAQEVLALSTRFGVLSEYTAFLALEGTDLGDWNALEVSCRAELDDLAVETRTGKAAVNQGLNLGEMRQQECVNSANTMWTEAEKQVATSAVQQVADRSLYRRGERWIDARLVTGQQSLEPDTVIDMGSDAHSALLEELVAEGCQGLVALEGEVLFEHGGKRVLVRNRGTRTPAAAYER